MPSSRLTGRKIRHLRAARKELGKALEYYEALQSRYAVPAEYGAVPGRIRKEITQCDQILEKLSLTTRAAGPPTGL